MGAGDLCITQKVMDLIPTPEYSPIFFFRVFVEQESIYVVYV